MPDLFNLRRFLDVQAPVYAQALAELRAGAKQSHWMWFIFPQIAGLGQSPTSAFFAVASLDEAMAYLANPVLGPRLRECSEAVLGVQGRTARQIFGGIDEMKFRSSMTLFSRAARTESVFAACLQKYFSGAEDDATIAKL